MPHLQQLSLSPVRLMKRIPDWLWKCSSLIGLNIGDASFEGPISGLGNLTTLQSLTITDSSITGPLPEDFGNLENLYEVTFSNTRLTGTLPQSFGDLTSLVNADFTSNKLTGTIPDSIGGCQNLGALQLSNNDFYGPLPQSFGNLHALSSLDLNNNRFNGPIPDSFYKLSKLQAINLAQNQFTSLPESFVSNDMGKLEYIDLSFNKLEGALPAGLFTLPTLLTLLVNNNRLSKPLPDVSSASSIRYFDASYNQIEGTIPNFLANNIERLFLQHNQLSGNLFRMNRIFAIDVSFNLLESWKDFFAFSLLTTQLINFKSNRFSGSIAYNDMNYAGANLVIFANNSLTGTIPNIAFVGTLKSHHFDFSNNQFYGNLPEIIPHGDTAASEISFLDFSNNNFSGTIPTTFGKVVGLETLSLANNHLTGDLSTLALGSSISVLSIQHNNFEFDISQFELISNLIYLNARDNLIYGSMHFSKLPLEFVDLSVNNLNSTLDLQDIARSFDTNLRFLSLANNPNIPQFISLISEISLSRTNSHQASNFSTTMCFELDFHTDHKIIFDYDDTLFGYLPCQCAPGYFGIPPLSCFGCPQDFGCDGSLLNVSKSYYIYPSTQTLSSHESQLGSCPGPIGVEPCQVGPLQGLSNCVGGSIKFDKSFSLANASQCAIGSYGRLCSNCICNMDVIGDSKCYFARGPTCAVCSSIWNTSKLLSIGSALVLIAFIISTTIMYLVIQSRRGEHKTRWEDLPLVKRLIHRLKHFVGLGMVSILIGFIQIYAEVTNYEAYALRAWLQVINGSLEGLGLVCLVPFARNSLGRLLARLFLPIGVLTLVSCSIYTAELIHILRVRFNNSKRQYGEDEVFDGFISISDGDDSSITQSLSLEHNHESHTVQSLLSIQSSNKMESSSISNSQRSVVETNNYPTTALVSNIGISILRFFYFSVSLGATEYFFSIIQLCTGLRFVQSHPWMPYHDAQTLRYVSIPFLVLYVIGMPLLFGLVLLKFRKHLSSARFEMYLGGIVSKFRTSTCWWELVLVIRKLSLALVLRGISESSSLYGGLILFILCSHGLLHFLLRPWKQSVDNNIDFVAAQLLILSQTAAQSGVDQKSHSDPWQYSLLSLVIVFVIAMVIIIIYQTIVTETEYQISWKSRHALFDDSGSNKDDFMTDKAESNKIDFQHVVSIAHRDDLRDVESDLNE
jgi:Leucine-rich repeat (LRR) protein